MSMYEGLAAVAEEADILILYNGANLHPEFVCQLGLFKVYTAGDDPESTAVLTRPLAPAFDMHLVNNVACVEMYRGWGLRHVHFWPLGSLSTVDDVGDQTDDQILDATLRPTPVVFFGEYQQHRRERLDTLVRAFPQAICAGRGWPRGFVPWAQMWSTYRRAQIGWNFHNSLGPVNFRSYELPAYGVLQICDNKRYLGSLFELDREVVGFDTVQECADLTRYFIAHPAKQRALALAGWKRWRRDYHPDKVWDRLAELVEPVWRQSRSEQRGVVALKVVHSLRTHRLRTSLWRLLHWGRQLLVKLKGTIVQLRPPARGQ